MFKEITCSNPVCEQKLFRQSSDGWWRLAGKVIKVSSEGEVVSVCKSCSKENPLNLTILPGKKQLLKPPKAGEKKLETGSGFVVTYREDDNKIKEEEGG